MDADESAVDWARLAQISSRRGFKRLVAVALILAGSAPAIALVVIRTPGYGDAPLIATLLVAVPAAVLLLWTMRDREGQYARELTMWVRSASRSEVELPADAQAAFHDLLDGPGSFATAALDVRDALSPLVAAPGLLPVRMAVYRFWYPIAWVAISVILVVAFFVVTAFGPPVPLG